MKKFIILIFTLIGIYFLFDLAYYRWSFFIPKSGDIEVISYADNKKLMIANDDSYEEVIVKGVNIGGSIPGHYVTDYAIPYETYYSWLESIHELGSNTVRLNTIFNDDFYDAFYDYNEAHDEKLYLIQGINLDSYVLNSHHDGFSHAYYGELITRAENAVDVVHGRKKMTLNNVGKGKYKKNVSKYVLAYVVGSEWIDDTIMYTDNKYKDRSGFSGNYISTEDGATPFETMLAKVLDHLITYETKKYNEQHSISFINSPATDPVGDIPVIKEDENEVTYLTPENLKFFYHKIVRLDIEHLKSQNNYEGLFAAYNISSYYPNYLSYEKDEYEDTYYTYLRKLNNHHKVPVLVTEFAYSTSRGVSSLADDKYGNFGGMTEEEQGNAFVNAYHTIIETGSAGGLIATWQDEWDKRSWNTIEKIDIPETMNWNDVQTTNQGLGLLTFDPGKEQSVCYVDGEISEWSEEDIVVDTKDLSLSVKQDEKYLYFFVDKKKNQQMPLYIPLDVTNKSGTKSADYYNLKFDRDVDFLIVLDGTEGKILVQEYYDVLNAVDGYELLGRNSYEFKPSKDSSKFDDINLLIEPYSTNKYSRNYKQATLVNTGHLTFGNGNPSSTDYNSQADFYENDGKIEIRIPWQILNFSDPSSMMIHDDYYEHYGVESYKIDELYLGASFSSDISLSSYKLKPWGEKITYHERLKKSYDIVKKDWRG